MTVSVRLEDGEICTGEPVEIPAWQSASGPNASDYAALRARY